MYRYYVDTQEQTGRDGQGTTDRAGHIDTEVSDASVPSLDRGSRFVDVGKDSDMFKSKSLNDLKTYYNGFILADRMAEIRKSIYHIRQNWKDFDQFLEAAKTLVHSNDSYQFKDEKTKQKADVLLSSRRDWLKESDVGESKLTYEAIQVYTSQEGYQQIYGLANRIFRQADSIDIVSTTRSVVFLIELINIDLFNYCLVFPNKSNFEGVVYRGLCLEEDDIESYRQLRKEPIGKRYIAVPLGMLSSSSSRRVADVFMANELKNQTQGGKKLHPLLLKIHVIGLTPEYLKHYAKTFPTSVLSTICAVDIHELSTFPKECEVLLRGPFFVVLDVYTENENPLGQPCDIVEMVMLNTNRDHISTAFLGDQDAKARDMFGTMVNVTRSKFALQFCIEKSLEDDAKEYRQLLETNLAKLDTLMKE